MTLRCLHTWRSSVADRRRIRLSTPIPLLANQRKDSLGLHAIGASAMRYGASTFIWVSPFSNRTLDLIDKVKALGFDIIEICVEDPETIDVDAIRARAAEAGVGVTVCGAFGPGRDLSSEDGAVRKAGLDYLRRCIDFAAGLGSPFVSGPMYAAVGNTKLLDERRVGSSG